MPANETGRDNKTQAVITLLDFFISFICGLTQLLRLTHHYLNGFAGIYYDIHGESNQSLAILSLNLAVYRLAIQSDSG